MIEFRGRLIEIIYKNESNGYLVGLLSADDEDVTIVGCIPTVKEGEDIQVRGNWTVHPSYGRQLEVKEFQPLKPSTVEGIISYLSSGIIKGIGERMAKRIVQHFGEETLDIMQFQPQRLMEVSGIGASKADAIANAFHHERGLREVVLFLSRYAISPTYSIKIYKKYGEATISLIHENPYRLAEDIIGIGFRKADEIAKSMGIPIHSKYRIQAATKYILISSHGEGNTYLPKKILIKRVCDLIHCEMDPVEDAIQSLALEEKIHIDKHKDEYIIYSMPYYYAETNVCKNLIKLSQVVIDSIEENIEDILKDITKSENIWLAEKQKEAIYQGMKNGIMVITGGPGTGKTTIIKTLIKLFEGIAKRVVLAAPTGRASKRMTEATGMEAKTIHRLLEIGYIDGEEEMNFHRNEENPLEADVVIIDEVSMVDILLMNHLLKAISVGTRLILVGDADQLPAVGAGNVLKDIIQSNIIKVVRLKEIFRQAQESLIILNAHRINEGNRPTYNVKDKDFFFLTKNKRQDMVDTLQNLVKDRLPGHYNYHSLKDIQVITPMKKGDTGAENLNKVLQDCLNPPNKEKEEKEYRGRIFRVGDKVMQIKNNYSLKWTHTNSSVEEDKGEGVFNGDIGYITYIRPEENEMAVLFDDGRLVVYDFTQLDELELAYCITVHKSQGSEFPVVVMPITWGPPMLLTRNLLYTAVTRAKNLVVLVGTEGYLHQMIDNNRTIQRYSGLEFRLKKVFDYITKELFP